MRTMDEKQEQLNELLEIATKIAAESGVYNTGYEWRCFFCDAGRSFTSRFVMKHEEDCTYMALNKNIFGHEEYGHGE